MLYTYNCKKEIKNYEYTVCLHREHTNKILENKEKSRKIDPVNSFYREFTGFEMIKKP